MGKKKNYERKVKRDSNLGTTDAIWKMMIDIFFMKKEGRKIHYDQVFAYHQVGKFRVSMIEEAIGDAMPTRDDAEALRIRKLEYEREHYGKRKDDVTAEGPAPEEQMIFGFDYGEGPDTTAMFVLNGHTYKIIQID